jgi:hypothetical protein
MCYLEDLSVTLERHKEYMTKALDYLRDNMPRTIVNLVAPPREYVFTETYVAVALRKTTLKASDHSVLHLEESCFWTLSIL